MRIVGGAWAGRELVSPGGRVRPTAEDVREAAMEMLRDDLKDARVADLFAGTGALGLEALSRGAKWCDFVEDGPAAMHALKANVAAFRLGRRGRVFVRDAIPFVERLPADAYDLAFVDPPYGSRKLDRVLEQWLRVPFARILLLEHAPEHELPRGGAQRRIRDTVVTVLRSEAAPAP